MKIYVASSWKTPLHYEVVELLEEKGHQVYDYRQAGPALGPHWPAKGTPVPYRDLHHLLNMPQAQATYTRDMKALIEAEAVVCVMPCGRSAHLELGYAIGAGKLTYLVWDVPDEPDVMHRAVDAVVSATDMRYTLPPLLENKPTTTAIHRLYQSPRIT